MTRARNPLEPASTVLSILLGLAGTGIAVGVLATLFGSGSVMGIGRATVSVDVTQYVGGDNLSMAHWHPNPGTDANLLGYRFFTGQPDLSQRLLYTLTLLPNTVLAVGALILAYRVIRGAERGGIYTLATAGRLRVLGWFLLVAGVVQAVVPAVAANRLLATMVTDNVSWFFPVTWHVPWSVLVTGAGLLTLARMTRLGAAMQDELQATV